MERSGATWALLTAAVFIEAVFVDLLRPNTGELVAALAIGLVISQLFEAAGLREATRGVYRAFLLLACRVGF